MRNRAWGHASALFTMLVWGLTFVSTKVLLDYLTPLDILLSRTILGFLALCLVSPRILRTRRRSDELLFALAGLTGTFGYYLAENTALQFADASFVSVAVSTAPLFTGALGFALLKEEGFGARFVLGFAIALSGIALVSFAEGPVHASPIGVALCLAGAMTWAVYSLIVKRLSGFGYATIPMTKRIFVWGLAFMAVTRIAIGGAYPIDAIAQPTVLMNLAFLGILASAGCFVTWGYSVKHLGATAASAYIYLQAPITVVAAVLMLGEPMTALIALGIMLVLAGLCLSEGFDRQLARLIRPGGAERS